MRIDKSLCDNCGKEDLHKCFPVTMSCGFGSIFDELVLDFCSDECCMNFIKDKIEECKSGKGYNLPVRENFEKKLNDVVQKDGESGSKNE